MNNTCDKVVMSKIAFERMQSKDERDNHSKNIIIILLIVLLVATNGMWLYAWNTHYVGNDYSVDIKQNDSGDINYSTETIIRTISSDSSDKTTQTTTGQLAPSPQQEESENDKP